MDIFDMGRIASRYDTEIAHAMLCAVAVATYRIARSLGKPVA